MFESIQSIKITICLLLDRFMTDIPVHSDAEM